MMPDHVVFHVWQLVRFERAATPPLARHAKAVARSCSPQKVGRPQKKSKAEWKLAKERLKLGTKSSISENEEVVIYADPEGNDAMYKSHAVLPTFACVERFQVTSGPADYFILHPVESDGSYRLQPKFFAGKGAPSIDQKLSSLHTRGDLMNLASASAATGKLDLFWDTISVIRQVLKFGRFQKWDHCFEESGKSLADVCVRCSALRR